MMWEPFGLRALSARLSCLWCSLFSCIVLSLLGSSYVVPRRVWRRPSRRGLLCGHLCAAGAPSERSQTHAPFFALRLLGGRGALVDTSLLRLGLWCSAPWLVEEQPVCLSSSGLYPFWQGEVCSMSTWDPSVPHYRPHVPSSPLRASYRTADDIYLILLITSVCACYAHLCHVNNVSEP